jgi:hypothetical protein
MAVDCGPVVDNPGSCLAAASAAIGALPADHPVVAGVDIGPWAPTGPAAANLLPTSDAKPGVLVDTTVTAFGVTVRGTAGYWLRTTVFQGADGWLAGEPPAASRTYTASQPVRDWRDQPAFEIAGGEYVLDARCFGDPPTKGSATGRLERVTDDGHETVGVFTCGPVELGDAFETHLALAAGQYRVVIEASSARLQVWFQPVHGD